MPAEFEVLEERASALPSVKNRLSLYLYLAAFIACPLLIVIVALIVVRTTWFVQHAGVPYLMTMGYGARLHDANCEIAVYGDSTAMIGVYPEIIAQRTKLSTCNIAENAGMTVINDTLVLDQFLENNPRPRFIVFLYAPEVLNPQSRWTDPNVTLFEGMTYRFRQHFRFVTFLKTLRHPNEVLNWADHSFRLAVEGLHVQSLPLETQDSRDKTLGRVPFQGPSLTSCDSHSRATAADKAWIKGLRERYSAGGTTVLVDSMLLPECDPDVNFFRRELSGVTDNQVGSLPVSDYYSGGRHVNADGGLSLSNMIAEQILARARGASGKEVR